MQKYFLIIAGTAIGIGLIIKFWENPHLIAGLLVGGLFGGLVGRWKRA